MRYFLLLLVIPLLSSCNLPAKWAEEITSRVKCDMTLEQVQTLTHREIHTEEVPRSNMTHYIRDGQTDVWFVFEDDKLKSVQVLWAQEMMKTASYQPVQLCE